MIYVCSKLSNTYYVKKIYIYDYTAKIITSIIFYRTFISHAWSSLPDDLRWLSSILPLPPTTQPLLTSSPHPLLSHWCCHCNPNRHHHRHRHCHHRCRHCCYRCRYYISMISIVIAVVIVQNLDMMNEKLVFVRGRALHIYGRR